MHISNSNEVYFMKSIIKFVCILALIFTLSACASGLSESEMQTAVAQTIDASEQEVPTSQPSGEDCPTTEALPTYTPYPTGTPYPTYTPYPALECEEPVAADSPTSTPITPTIGEGIGSVAMCGEYFAVTVLAKPTELKSVQTTIDNNVYEEKATGEFIFVRFELVNESEETWDQLFTDEFALVGQVNGETLTYKAEFEATNFEVRNHGYANYVNVFYDETQPAVPFKAIVGFDVSPYGTDWVFVFKPFLPDTRDVACEVHIPLE